MCGFSFVWGWDIADVGDAITGGDLFGVIAS
jgi:hypothetical protein